MFLWLSLRDGSADAAGTPCDEGAAAGEFFGQIKNRLGHNFFLLVGGPMKGRNICTLRFRCEVNRSDAKVSYKRIPKLRNRSTSDTAEVNIPPDFITVFALSRRD